MSVLRTVTIIAAVLVSLSPIAAGAADDARIFEYQDIFQIEQAREPQFSPGGKSIVYVRRSMDIMSDRPRSNLWIINRDGTGHRPLESGTSNYSSPRFSPDGARLAYLSNDEGSSQIYVRWMDTGQTARVTNLTHRPSGLSWSPDGSSLAFTMLVPTATSPMISMPKTPKGAEWAEPAKEITSLRYRFDGRGYLEQGFSHVFVVPAEGGTPRQITSGDFDHNGTPVWLPDGRSVLISTNRNEDWQYDPRESDIYEISIADGSVTRLTDRIGPDHSPAVSPDGRHIAYLGNDDDGMSYLRNVLYVMNRDGSEKRALTASFEGSLDNPQWAQGGRSIVAQYTSEGKIIIARIDLRGRISSIIDDAGGLSLGRPYAAASFVSDGGNAIAYTRTATDRPSDLGYATLSGGKRRLTGLNEDLLGHKTLGAVKGIRFPSSFDQRQIEAWVVTPPDFDATRKYPLILEIHGGPYAAYGPHFAAEFQLMASQGYVVVYANPRGSTSYGDEFANLIHQNYPSEDYDDLMSAVDAVIAEGYIDQNNLFVTGGSGGGVLSSWIVGKTDRFASAVVAKPIVNWISAALTTDISMIFTKYWMPGFPWEFHEKYWQHSSLSLVGNVTTPTMIITGEVDFRTPISENEQFYKALKLQKVDAAMVRIPDASHGITARPSNLIRKVKYVLAWFDKYRTDKTDKTAEEN